jgi:hypothetical protein
MPSEYQQLVAIARRQGRGLPDIGAAWREANRAVHGIEISPRQLGRYHRQARTGRYLADGMPFRRALALASRRNPEPSHPEPSSPDAIRRVVRRTTRRVAEHRWRNPGPNLPPPLLLLGLGLAALAWLNRGTGGASPSASSSGPNTTPAVAGGVPPGTQLIPYSTWWSKYKNGGHGVPIGSVFPDVLVWDTPDGGMIGLPIPPPIIPPPPPINPEFGWRGIGGFHSE